MSNKVKNMRKTLQIEPELAKKLNAYCSELAYNFGELEADSIIFSTAVKFDDGATMIIEVSSPNEMDECSCSTSATLFDKQGNRCGSTDDFQESFLGIWAVDDQDDNNYEVAITI